MTFPTIAGSATSTQTTNSTSHTISLPGSISSGDLLVTCIIVDARPTLSGALTDDWTFILGDSPGSDLVRIFLYFRRATGSEGSTVAFTTNTAQCSAHRTYRITGAHESTNPFAGSGSAESSTINQGAVNPSTWDVEDTLWLFFVGNDDGTTTVTVFPTSYLNTGQQAAGNAADGVNIGWGTRENAVASEDPSAVTFSASESAACALVAVRPSAVTTVAPSAITVSTTFNNPLVQNMTLQMPSITETVQFTGHEPTLAYVITPSSISASVTMQSPTVVNLGTQQNVNPSFINVGTTMYAPSVYHVVVVTRSIAQGSDDGGEEAGGNPNIDGTTVIVGAVGSFVGLRFQNVQVPKDAQLVSALINVTLADSGKNDAEGTWYCEAQDNPGTFTADDGSFDGRTRTSSSVPWTTNDLGTSGTTVSTPSLLGPVNEIVTRSGWIHGNSMVFLYGHNSAVDQLALATLENVSLAEASLSISYLSLVTTIVAGSISAATTMHQPNIGMSISTTAITVSTVMHSPTIDLSNQFVMPDRIVEIPIAFSPIVGDVFGAASLKATVLETPKSIVLNDPDFAGAVLDQSRLVVAESSHSVVLRDQE